MAPCCGHGSTKTDTLKGSPVTFSTTRKSSVRTLSAKAAKPATQFGIVTGTLTGFVDDATPLVAIDGQPALAARTVVNVESHHIGETVAVQFERGDSSLPVVMGIVKTATTLGTSETVALLTTAQPLSATLDEDNLVLTAKRRITLQCGRASITLDDKGNVEIRGTYVLSRSSGQKRIKGSSVSLN
jgi:hypothetical protein